MSSSGVSDPIHAKWTIIPGSVPPETTGPPGRRSPSTAVLAVRKVVGPHQDKPDYFGYDCPPPTTRSYAALAATRHATAICTSVSR